MGATLVLVGLAGRTFGPSLRYRTPSGSADVLRAEQLVARFAWARFCSSLGATLALGGVLLLVVTGLLVVIHVDDGVGTATVLVTLAVIILAMAFWSWAFVQRFGLIGITAPRMQREPSPLETTDTFDDTEGVTDVPMASTVAAITPVPATTQSPPTNPQRATEQPGPPSSATTTTEAPRRTTQPPSLTRRDPAIVTVSVTERPSPTTTPLPPMVTHADPSRSEIVNPSDAAALDRILAERGDPPTPSPLLEDIEATDTERVADTEDSAVPTTTQAPANG
jgi:hypothetical protein